MKRVVILIAACAVIVFSTLSATVYAAPSKPAAESKPIKSSDIKKYEEKKAEPIPAPEPVMVTVEKGDSLSKIANRHETTWVRIYNANETVAHPDVIHPGDTLRIPATDEVLADRTVPQPVAAPAPQTVKTATKRASVSRSSVSYPVSVNSAKAYIYARESGNNPNATSPNGCYGLGQDCNGVVRGLCGADYACQDAFFTNYAVRRYGSWENALAFWQTHHWW